MQHIDTKVLIIGSGGAGLRCAVELFESGIKDILVVGDRKFEDSHTTLAQGGLNAALGTMDPKDSYLIHAFDTFDEGQMISNPVLVETLTKNAPGAIDDLIRFGANFHKESDGRFTQRFFGAHTWRRTLFSGDETGKEIIRVLVKQSNKLEIPHLENTYIFKILVEGGEAYGAMGIKNDELIIINASKVVLASGGFSNIYNRSSSRKGENFGEGVALALREGAEIGDMEMVQFHPTGLVWPEEVAGDLVTEAVRGEGGILKNSLGERFMKKYDLKKEELSTRDVVARANYMEIQAGRGTKNGGVYLDISHKDEEYIKDRLPEMYRKLKEVNNINIANEPMEVAPTAHYTMGGVYYDSKSMLTNIKDLYAVGEVTMGVHGANRLGGNSLAEILVFGKLTGQSIVGSEFKVKKADNILTDDVEKFIKNHFEKDGELNTEKAIEQARQIMWDRAGIIRDEENLKKGEVEIQNLKQEIIDKSMKNSNNLKESLIQKIRLETIIQLGELVIAGAKERKESRGAHYRSDFTKKDSQYEFNIIFKRDGEGTKVEHRNIPSPSAELQKTISEMEKTKNYGHLE